MPTISYADQFKTEEFVKFAACVLKCQGDCEDAKDAFNTADSKCSTKKTECNKSILTAKENCCVGCDTPKNAAIILCMQQDDVVVRSCTNAAITAHTYCINGCNKADYETSECNEKSSVCSEKDSAKEKKKTECARDCKAECK